MTLPRWWDNRFMLGLVLTTLVLAGVVHLWSFVPGSAPGALYWVLLLCWVAVTLDQFLPRRHLRPQPPAPRGFRAAFTTGPLWLRLFNYAQALLMGYSLLSLVLLVADPHTLVLRVISLLAANQCLSWLRTYLTTRPAPGAGRVA